MCGLGVCLQLSLLAFVWSKRCADGRPSMVASGLLWQRALWENGGTIAFVRQQRETKIC